MILFLLVLVLASFRDIRDREVPNWYWIIILILAGISVYVYPEVKMWRMIAGGASVSVPLLLITLLSPGAFGGADIKMAAVSGCFLGIERMVLGAVSGIFLAGVACVYLLAKGRSREETIAFIPFLSAGVILSIFFTEPLAHYIL